MIHVGDRVQQGFNGRTGIVIETREVVRTPLRTIPGMEAERTVRRAKVRWDGVSPVPAFMGQDRRPETWVDAVMLLPA